ncbi:hypothetical protein ACIQUQ_19880 [Streptomyces sp. NPDC101118]|uniref:hypothetical protein n=1 Tax=Streptomyces sp. NPDC101118 TaxID=3366109 RepID=UPI0037FBAA33
MTVAPVPPPAAVPPPAPASDVLLGVKVAEAGLRATTLAEPAAIVEARRAER